MEGGEIGKMPEIKLFGKNIKLPTERTVSMAIEEEYDGNDDKFSHMKACCEPEETNKEAPNSAEEKAYEQNESNNNLEDKSPKKPDKILPCPRCNSMDTKFCYYNNYNVNQPRHFCKNCQRYWTAGGSMRNVPVGAGRRKSKCSTPIQQYRQIVTPNFVQANAESGGTVLSFGSNAPLNESIASVMNLVEKTAKNCEQLSQSTNSNDELKESTNSNSYGFPPNASYFNGTPCPYPWTPPPFFVPSFSFPLYPMNAYWSMPMNAIPSILGKHSRDGSLLNHNNSDKGSSTNTEKCIWIPKTLKVDDHEKAGKPPFWSTLEFQSDRAGSLNRGEGLFKAFQSSGCNKINSNEVSQILLANPAAVSRSFDFQEC